MSRRESRREGEPSAIKRELHSTMRHCVTCQDAPGRACEILASPSERTMMTRVKPFEIGDRQHSHSGCVTRHRTAPTRVGHQIGWTATDAYCRRYRCLLARRLHSMRHRYCRVSLCRVVVRLVNANERLAMARPPRLAVRFRGGNLLALTDRAEAPVG
jgi:hypothetical protein